MISLLRMVLILTFVVLVVACGSAQTPAAAPATPTTPPSLPPTNTPAPLPTATALPPTPTSAPSATPSPTEVVLEITGDADKRLSGPTGMALDGQSNLYVVDAGNACIQKFDVNGKPLGMWGSAGKADGQFNFQWGDPKMESLVGDVAVDAQGNIYVADSGNFRVQKFDSSGKFLLKWGSEGKGDGQFGRILGLTLDKDGNVYTVDDRGVSRIQKFDATGKFLAKFGEGQYFNTGTITLDNDGTIYLADFEPHRVIKLDPNGKKLAEWSTDTEGDLSAGPGSIALDRQGNVYVVTTFPPRLVRVFRVLKFDGTGKLLAKWGGSGTLPGLFREPFDIVLDAQGNVYVSDSLNHRIQKFRQRS